MVCDIGSEFDFFFVYDGVYFKKGLECGSIRYFGFVWEGIKIFLKNDLVMIVSGFF